MNDRQLRKIQKQRHMSDIAIMILNNPVFKNLEDKDRKKLALLIYKAEMIEMHVRDRDVTRVNRSFQNIVDAINLALLDEDEDEDFFGSDEDNK